MRKLFNTLILFLLFTNSIYAADEIEKGKTLLKSFSKKTLTKKETISFLKEYAVIVEDERGDGKVTYVFDDDMYSRYKETEIISTDAWRFSKLGALRLFNKDIKMTWKIKINDKENLVNIKTKFDPVGKLYEFEVKNKKEFLDQIEQVKQDKIEEKKKLEQEKLAAEQKLEEEKKKLEQERLAAEQKLEEEKKKLEQEKLAAEQKLEEEKKKLEQERLAAEQKLEEEKRKLEAEKLALEKELEKIKEKKGEELEQIKKTPAQIKKEERERKKKEKLAEQKKINEEKERLKQEKLAARKKAKEEKERLKQEKLAARKKAEELEKLKGSTDWNRLFDAIANRWMNPSLSTPGGDETLVHLCLWKKIDKSYLSGNFLMDGIYNVGLRADYYDKINPIFLKYDQKVEQSISGMSTLVNCDKFLKRFSK